jgi:AAA domain
MRRFIITGAPGAGKTAIIRQLELDGFSVVEEAATDVSAAVQAQGIVEPWRHPSFTKTLTGTSASNWSRSSQEVWWNGSAPSKRQFVSRHAECPGRVPLSSVGQTMKSTTTTVRSPALALDVTVPRQVDESQQAHGTQPRDERS